MEWFLSKNICSKYFSLSGQFFTHHKYEIREESTVSQSANEKPNLHPFHPQLLGLSSYEIRKSDNDKVNQKKSENLPKESEKVKEIKSKSKLAFYQWVSLLVHPRFEET